MMTFVICNFIIRQHPNMLPPHTKLNSLIKYQIAGEMPNCVIIMHRICDIFSQTQLQNTQKQFEN